MPFTLIKGTFHVVGRRPDGDTVSFAANDKSHWQKLSGPMPRFNMGGIGNITSLRFEAIDTLESHFRPGGRNPEIHQPQPSADDATDFQLKMAGEDVAVGLIDTSVVMPKLFRRLTEYLRTNNDNVQGFKQWLKDRQEQILVLAPDMMGKITTFDDVIFESGKRIKLTTDPENLIFKP